MRARTGLLLTLLVLTLGITTAALTLHSNQWAPNPLMPQQTQKGIPNWGNEKQANTYTTSNQEFPSVYMFPDGSFVVAWQSYGQDGDVDGIYAKLYDPSGKNKTGEIRVNGYTTSYQRDPCVHGFSDGSFVVAWYGYGQGGSSYDIYFKLFDSTGNNKTDDILANGYTTDTQESVCVSVFSDDSFVLVWQSVGQDGDGYGVYFKLFDSTGNNKTDDILANGYTTNNQKYPSVCVFSDGSFVVAWQSGAQDGNHNGVFMKLFDSTGNNRTDDIQVNDFTTNDQNVPRVCGLTDGSFVATWQSEGQDGDDFGIYMKLYNSDCSNKTGEIRVNGNTTNGQSVPSACALSSGLFMVVWQSETSTDNFDIFAKIFDSNGQNLTDDALVNVNTTNSQNMPTICGLTSGSFVVAWESSGQDGDGYGIYFRTGSVPQAAAPYGVFVYAVFLMQSESSARASFSGGVLLAAGIVAVFAAYWWWFIRKP